MLALRAGLSFILLLAFLIERAGIRLRDSYSIDDNSWSAIWPDLLWHWPAPLFLPAAGPPVAAKVNPLHNTSSLLEKWFTGSTLNDSFYPQNNQLASK